MKTRRTVIAFLVILSQLLISVPQAGAVPPLPSSLHGTVKVDGANVDFGTSITAWINGVQYAYTTTTTYNGDSVYALDVPGDDPSTPEIEGGVSGDTIVFHIGSQLAEQHASWVSGVPATLNLTVSTANGINCTSLSTTPTTRITDDKPQSKVWKYGGSWYAVFPTSTSGAPSAGTWLWKLNDLTWSPALKLSDRTDTKADVKPVGSMAHILLWADTNTQYVTVDYVAGAYQLWATRPTAVSISLPGSESATIESDSTGRLWIATRSASGTTGYVVAYTSVSPYGTWTGPITLATGIVYNDDIAAIIALPGKIGVFWANETASVKRFGFRTHVDGTDPNTWTADEVPASQSAHDDVGTGMADDHMNLKVGSDGTLYAAVKTGYDLAGYPKMALLLRHPNGTWDDLYAVDQAGTRPQILLDETHGVLTYIYTSAEGNNNIIFRQSPTSAISFTPRSTFDSGSYNDVSTMKANITGDFVVIYGNGSVVAGKICTPVATTGADLSITKSDGVGAARPGDTLTYSIVASNAGPEAVTGATVTDTFPAGLNTISWTCAENGGGACAHPSGSGNISELVDLPVSGSVTYTVTAQVDLAASGQIANTATVAAPGGITDPNSSNNSATDTDTVTPAVSPCESDTSLVGCWQMEENGGSALADGSSYLNDGSLNGGPGWIAGKVGSYALSLNGTSQYGTVPDDNSLDLTNGITLAVWIRPGQYATQDILSKSTNGGVNGYQLSLSTTKADDSSRKVFFRINQATNGDTYRINSTTVYPIDGTWIHAAATYDGTTMKLYINGALENNLALPAGTTIAVNSLPLGIGAQGDGTRFFTGALDEARIYNRALSQAEIQTLVDNHAPTDISLSSSSVAENQPINTVVGALSSTDPDAGNTFTYTLVSGAGSTDNASFNIAGANLQTSEIFNYEAKSSYSIRVRTTDQGGLWFEKAFTITVSNANDAPTDISLSNSTLPENQPANTVVGALSSTDVDSGDTFTYSLVSGSGSTDNASFNILGANLRTSAPLDYETKSSYSIRVRTTDGGGLWYEKAFTITLTDVNESPTDISLSSSSVAENQPINTVVGALSSTDPDAGNTFTYTLVSGSGSADNASFNILSGNLRTSASFDYETKSSYSIRIRSTDQGGLYFEKAFTITVTNANETPTDISLGSTSVAENSAINTVVGALSTSDVDSADTFTYTLVSGTGSTDNASFNTLGSSLRTSAIFNYEAKSSYSIRVRSTDQGGLWIEKAFTITITNANDAPTDISLSNSSVTENSAINTVVGALSSTDEDSGDTFTYMLVGGTGSTNNASFNILGGNLRTSASFDYEAKSSYSIRVRTTDLGGAWVEKVFTITVTNANEAPTDISLIPSSVAENEPINTVVGALSTIDPDSGNNFTYTLVSGSGSTDNASFNIAGGNLRTSESFNYEARPSYSIRVRSTDQGGLWVEKALTITINNANDAPVITEGDSVHVTMSENGSPTPFSLTLHATDPDTGDTLTWYTWDASYGTASGEGTGASMAIGYIPDTSFYGDDSFVVQVSDGHGGTDSITVNVTVTHVNTAPTITEGTSVSVTILQDGMVFPFDLTLHVTDPDVDDVIAWSISGAAAHGTATATGTGRSLRIAYKPASGYTGSDSFVVHISDGNGGTATITVHVTILNAKVIPLVFR